MAFLRGWQMQAKGTFDITMTPQAPAEGIAAAQLGRMTLDKRYQGDLEATSLGEMLAAGTAVDGSAGYVAMERVQGRLHGCEGGFVLLHRGVMDRGKPDLQVQVVPDSGTGDLVGLSGTLTIGIEQGRHHYSLDYRLD